VLLCGFLPRPHCNLYPNHRRQTRLFYCGAWVADGTMLGASRSRASTSPPPWPCTKLRSSVSSHEALKRQQTRSARQAKSHLRNEFPTLMLRSLSKFATRAASACKRRTRVIPTTQQPRAAERAYIEPRVGSGDDAADGGLAVCDGRPRLQHKLVDVLGGVAVTHMLRSACAWQRGETLSRPLVSARSARRSWSGG
jgi:hypothetical protein